MASDEPTPSPDTRASRDYAGPEPASGARTRFRRWVRWLALAAGVILLLFAGCFGAVVLTLPAVDNLRSGWPQRTSYMERREQEAEGRGQPLAIDYRPVPLSRIPADVQRAVLVSEDAAFYGHGGFDWFELRAAIAEAWRDRESPRGASTITQQLARNLYLSPERSLFRKLREALIARRLERELSKQRILELYLNVIELGPGIFGVEAGSRRYFGISITGVSRLQAAKLAATIPSPLRNNPHTDTGRHRWRTRLVYQRAFGTS